jgi:oligoribonuclease (3'-5' exoribonuclease)
MKQVTDEELQQIQSMREQLVEIVTLVGEQHLNKVVVEGQLQSIEQQLTTLEQRFAQFQEQERVLFEQLQQKYGTGNINIETGEIVD